MSGREREKNRNKQIKKKKTDLHMWEERNIVCRLAESQDRRKEKKKKVKDVAIKQQVNSLNREGGIL